MKALKATLVSVLAVLAVAACGDQNAVGSQSLTNFTPAPSPRAIPSPSPSPVAGGPGTHPSPVTQHSTAPPAVTVTVAINADTSSHQMDPSPITVAAGTIVKWVNHDTVARGIEAANNSFKSPPIPPGGSWTYTFSVSGTYDYQDSTRPYVTGEVVVR